MCVGDGDDDDEHLLSGLRVCLLVYREAAIESSDTPSVQTVDAGDNDEFEFDDERLDAMGAKTAKAFTAAVRQHLDRDATGSPDSAPGC